MQEITEQLKVATNTIGAREARETPVKSQLIYAFNGTGKTRLSRAFKELIAPKDEAEETGSKILYYNAFTEDLFYWDNDLEGDSEVKLKIQPNAFTQWVLMEQGQDQNVITNFQHYTNDKLTPHFNENYSEVTFSFERGNEESDHNIKISKGEESNFIWSIFYTLIEEVIDVLNVPEADERTTNKFDDLEYIFIDDPVSSLDENHLIELAVDLAKLINSSTSSELKFIITTHNPLFYNVLHNALKKSKKYILKKFEDETYQLLAQSNDSPFSYHLHLKAELDKAIEAGQLNKYHFNYLRNILEKTSTFFGYKNWGELLPETEDGRANPYLARIINISSHSKHSAEEVSELTEDDKRVLRGLVRKVDDMYKTKLSSN